MTIREEIEKIKSDKPSPKSVVNFLGERCIYYDKSDDHFQLIQQTIKPKVEIDIELQTIIELIEKEVDFYIVYLLRFYDKERNVACIKEYQASFDENHDIMIGLYKHETGYVLMFEYKRNNK